jgi:hypothetical protein
MLEDLEEEDEPLDESGLDDGDDRLHKNHKRGRGPLH